MWGFFNYIPRSVVDMVKVHLTHVSNHVFKWLKADLNLLNGDLSCSLNSTEGAANEHTRVIEPKTTTNLHLHQTRKGSNSTERKS